MNILIFIPVVFIIGSLIIISIYNIFNSPIDIEENIENEKEHYNKKINLEEKINIDDNPETPLSISDIYNPYGDKDEPFRYIVCKNNTNSKIVIAELKIIYNKGTYFNVMLNEKIIDVICFLNPNEIKECWIEKSKIVPIDYLNINKIIVTKVKFDNDTIWTNENINKK